MINKDMRFSFLKTPRFFFILLCSFILSLNSGVSAQLFSTKPEINRVEPKEMFPEMFISVIGFGLYSESGRSQIIFTQGDNILKVHAGSGGILDDGRWKAVLMVPKELKPGICKIQAEVDGKKSSPYFVNVSKSANPPKLVSVSAGIVNPGYFVWIEGIGFGNNQILEMIDSEGQKFTKIVGGVSTNNSLSFDVPLKAYSGIAKFRVLENRNGIAQSSNEIKFEIRRGAIPVLFNKRFFVPLSPGQWFGLNLNDARPLYKATKIELKLYQRQKKLTSFVTDFRKIHFQVPKIFHKGKMKIQTRTWIGNDVSEWSGPLEFTIVDKPAKPRFSSLEKIPVKAEAMFKLNGETIDVLPIHFGGLPRVGFPSGLQKGKLQIYTRYWFQNSFTEWKRVAEFSDFDIERDRYNDHPEYYKEKSYTFNPFFERIWFENNSPEFYKVDRGMNLVIYGRHYAESSKDLQFFIENGMEKVFLKSLEFEFRFGALINIPNDTPKGDWRIWYINRDNNGKTRLPIKLKVE